MKLPRRLRYGRVVRLVRKKVVRLVERGRTGEVGEEKRICEAGEEERVVRLVRVTR